MKFCIMSSDLSNDFHFVFDQSSTRPLYDSGIAGCSNTDENKSSSLPRQQQAGKHTLQVPRIVILDESEQVIKSDSSDNEGGDVNGNDRAENIQNTRIRQDRRPLVMQQASPEQQPITQRHSLKEIESSMERKRSSHRVNNAPFSNNENPKAATHRTNFIGKLQPSSSVNKPSHRRPRSNTLNTNTLNTKTNNIRRNTAKGITAHQSNKDTKMKRRSFSHPDQLNLIITAAEDESSCHHGLSNGGLVNRCNSISSSNRRFSLSHDDDLKAASATPSVHDEDTETGGISREEESFSPLLDDSEPEESNLWSHRPSEFKLRDQLYSFFQASDNKLAMKLFGSRNALLKEKRRQMATKTWIIHPCSNFRLYWDLLMLIFLITNLVVLPVSIAFFYDDVGAHWIVFNITCDTMFILDIVINFRTGLIDDESHGNVILDPKLIALRYLKSWFAIDFISSLPLDYVFLGLEGQSYSAGRALRILRLAKLLQLLRLLRISRLVRYVRLWQEFFSLASIVVKLFNLICVMVLMGHWSGCIQFFVPVIQGLPHDSWIVLNNLENAHWWEQYSKALFKALSHMLCIGYGQFPPRNMTDTWLTIASMLAGATCYALFIGHATTLIQSFDTSSRQFRDHLQQVNEYMIYRKLPPDLRRRITDYYDHRFGGKLFDEAAILSEISDSLRKDVIYHNCRELIRNVPFFVNADNSFVTDVITKLEFEMFQPGDIIVKVDTKGDRMFFIQEGLIEIITDKGKVVTRLGDGSYFGEICLLTQQKRTATVRAASYCNLFSLSKEHFDRILENYPLMRRTLETIAAKRLHTLGKDPNLVTSRESLLDDINGIQRVFQVGDLDSSEDETDRVTNSTPSKESNSQFLTVVKSFFTKDSEEFSPHSRSTSMRTGLTQTSQQQSSMSRCKSAINQLVLVPHISSSLARRTKSTADVQLFGQPMDFKEQRSLGDISSPSQHNSRRSSLSPSFKRHPRRKSESPRPPTAFWDKLSKRKASCTQPNTPDKECCSTPLSNGGTGTDSQVFNPLIPPRVTITMDDGEMSDIEENERVRFSLD